MSPAAQPYGVGGELRDIACPTPASCAAVGVLFDGVGQKVLTEQGS